MSTVTMGERMQSAWDYVYYDVFEQQELLCFYTILLVVTELFFWVPVILLTIMDITKKPHWLYKYKIQPDVPMPDADPAILKRLLKVNIFNMCFLYPLVLFLCWPLFRYTADLGPKLPTLRKMLLDVLVVFLLYEFLFYYFHRALHIRWLYDSVHRVHHEMRTPMGLTGIYAHPFEFVLATPLAPALGVIVSGGHLTTIVLIAVLQVLGATYEHSGYAFPFLPGNEFHDYHHIRYDQNLGLFGLLDYLHGTDRVFRKHMRQQKLSKQKLL